MINLKGFFLLTISCFGLAYYYGIKGVPNNDSNVDSFQYREAYEYLKNDSAYAQKRIIIADVTQPLDWSLFGEDFNCLSENYINVLEILQEYNRENEKYTFLI